MGLRDRAWPRSAPVPVSLEQQRSIRNPGMAGTRAPARAHSHMEAVGLAVSAEGSQALQWGFLHFQSSRGMFLDNRGKSQGCCNVVTSVMLRGFNMALTARLQPRGKEPGDPLGMLCFRGQAGAKGP